MGRSIADVTIDVNLDAQRLPEQAQKAATITGAEAGEEFKKAFDKGMSELGAETKQKLVAAGAEGSVAFEKEFENAIEGMKTDLDLLQTEMVKTFANRDGFALFLEGSAGVDDAVEKIEHNLLLLADAGRIADDTLDDLGLRTQEFAADAKLAAELADGEAFAMEELARAIRTATLEHINEVAAAEEAAHAINDAKDAAAQLALGEELATKANKELAKEFAETAAAAGLAEHIVDHFAHAQIEGAVDAEIYHKQLTRLTHEMEQQALGAELAAEANKALRDEILFDAAAAGVSQKALAKFRNVELEGALSALALKAELKGVRDEELEVAAAAEAAEKALKKQNKAASGGGERGLNGLPGELDDVVLIVVAVAAAAGEIATLGAAAGAGIGILATAFVAAGVGAVALGVGLKGITGDLSKVAPEARPAATALQGMKGAFGDLQQAVQGDLFKGLGPTLESLGKRDIPVLQQGLEGLAGVGNETFLSLSKSLQAPSTLKDFSTLLDGFRPIFKNVLDAAISLGAAVGKIFIAALPYAQQFSGYLADLFKRFNDFLASTEGQNKLAAFFSDGYNILSKFGDLVGSAGKLLGALVTPQTVASTSEFLDSLTSFMPVLGQVLGALSQFDVFGIIAKALDIFGNAITPLLPALNTLAGVLGGAITQIFTAFAPLVTQVAQQFAPLLVIIGDLVAQVLPPLLQVLVPLVGAFTTFGAQIAGIVVSALEALMPFVGQLLQALIPLTPIVSQILSIFVSTASAVFSALLPAFIQLLPPIIQLISAVLPPLLQIITALAPVFTELISAVTPLIPSIVEVVQAFLPLLTLVLPPLLKLIALLVTAMASQLATAIRTVTPIITSIGSAITDEVIPVFRTLTTVLGDVINFVTDVFAGRWGAAWNDVKKLFTDAVGGLGDIIRGGLNGSIDILNGAIGSINSLISAVDKIPGISIPQIPGIPKLATGQLVLNPMVAEIGEAGPEAVVPLNRPLSQVSPDVRALSAIAQGIPYPGTEGLSSSAGRQITIMPGAFQITSATDSVVAASQLIDRFVASIA